MEAEDRKLIYLPDVVGKGYGTFWNYKGRYRVVKGSRASKKSKTIALNLVVRMMQYPLANAVVIRKVARTLHDSCFAEIKWAVNRLGVQKFWKFTESPLEASYVPTGQKIYFRGLDDSQKIASITVSTGYLCWAWIEEAYEITSESDFDMLDESIRGALPPETGLFKQITLSFNPWNEHSWLKKRFFDNKNNDTLAITTNYKCNEWLDEADRMIFEKMRMNNPKRYRVAGLGEWGVSEGVIYENWEEKAFDVQEISEMKGTKSVFGLDFGFSADPAALFCGLVNNGTLWVFDELYERGMTNQKLAKKIIDMGYRKVRIKADCAEPKSIEELREAGLSKISPCRKGKDSLLNGIQYIQNYHIIIHPKCVNFITEISNYAWETKDGKQTDRPIDDFNHLMDAMRYGMEDLITGPTFSFE